ncbi:hypothetical protein NQ318_015404 [Aromia moschata]|uniref:BTB domain-containing protein n=1 Tax=Aromia moschata TaxID=1265417 RepID=A0AAV8YQ28_9CUCU|nr:hypothetical protein NQ318_015404 [Aromia moschata]
MSGYEDDAEPSPSKNRRKGSVGVDENESMESCQMTIDNSENILKVLNKLYAEKEMCDVLLKVGNNQFAAHRLILCASSDVFQVMLMRPEWSGMA